MNERIEKLAEQCYNLPDTPEARYYRRFDKQKFAELIIEECRTVVCELYRNTPLEYCGVLLSADQAIAEHFYKVNK